MFDRHSSNDEMVIKNSSSDSASVNAYIKQILRHVEPSIGEDIRHEFCVLKNWCTGREDKPRRGRATYARDEAAKLSVLGG